MNWADDSLVGEIISDGILPGSSADNNNDSSKELQGSTADNSAPLKNAENPASASAPVKIDLIAAYKLFEKNVLFVDARTLEDFSEGHIRGAYSIPYYDENVENLLSRIDKNEPVVVYCNGKDCDLSEMMGNKMYKLGFKKVFVFFGGWEKWIEKNYPVER